MKRTLTTLVAALVALSGAVLASPASAAAPPAAKSFTVTVAPASTVWSQAVKLTASITPRGGGAPRGGTVTFLVDGTPIGTAPATTRVTSLTTRALPVGTHAVTATYSGDAAVAPGTTSTSAPVTVVPASTSTAVTITDTDVAEGETVEVRAVVRPVSPAATTRRPTGTVTFAVEGCDDTGTVALNANGVATWRRRVCSGAHDVTATYGGSDRHTADATTTGPLVVGEAAVDQSNLSFPGDQPHPIMLGNGSSATPTGLAQQLTAGRTGSLHAVDLQIGWGAGIDGAPGSVLVSIQTVDGDGAPTGTVLGSGSISTSDLAAGPPSSYRIDLDTDASVVAGTQYALVLEIDPEAPTSDGQWTVTADPVGRYGQGVVLAQYPGDGWLFSADPSDLVFRTLVTASSPD